MQKCLVTAQGLCLQAPTTSFQQLLETKEVEDALAKLHVEHVKLNGAHKSLRQEYSLTLAHLSQLKTESDSAVNRCAAAYAKALELEEARYSRLQTVLQSSKHDIAQLQSQRSESQSRLEELTEQKLSSETALADAHEELRKLKVQYASVKASHDDLDSSLVIISAIKDGALRREQDLLKAMNRLEAEHDAQLSHVADLKTQMQSHETLEAEYENLLSKHGRLNSEHELLFVDHQQLNADHGELSHEHQTLSTHNAELELENQRVLGQHRQKQYELTVAKEQQRMMFIQLESTKQAYGNDVHRLQDEVLSLEDSLQASKQQHMRMQNDNHKQLQQQAQLQAQMEQQSEDSHKATSTLGRKLQHSDEKASDLQMHLSQAEDDLSQCQHQLRVSETRSSELHCQLAQSKETESAVQSDLLELQADLKKLHELASGNHLSAQDLFQMFAEPGDVADTNKRGPPSTADTASAGASSGAASSGTGPHYLHGSANKSDEQPGSLTQTAPGPVARAPAASKADSAGTPTGPAAAQTPPVDPAAVSIGKPGQALSGTGEFATNPANALHVVCLQLQLTGYIAPCIYSPS